MQLLVLVGPTGSGKTAVAIELCRLLNGEVVSADSMQIYRGLDIGSAKPTAEEQRRARHHLIDVLEPQQSYSAAQWAEDARAAIEDIRSRGKAPIVAGGTGFYLRALLQPETLPSAPPDLEVRARLEAEAAAHGTGAAQHLHRKLRQLDTAAAARLHPNDVRRVIRAIEVALSPPFHSSLPAQRAPARHSSLVWGLEMPRHQLYRRLDNRTDAMLQAGFMDELRALMNAGPPPSSTLMQGLGIKQMRPALDDASRLDECVALWKRDTRRYAKRQMTWFRHQLPVQWIAIEDSTPPAQIARQIINDERAMLNVEGQGTQ